MSRKKGRTRSCSYCQQPMRGHRHRMTFDHVYPKANGGTLGDGNSERVCLSCNGDKGSWTISEWHALLTARGDYRAKIVAGFIDRYKRRVGFTHADRWSGTPTPGEITSE